MHLRLARRTLLPFAALAAALATPLSAPAQCGNVNWYPFVPGAYPANSAIPQLVFDVPRDLMIAVAPGPNHTTSVWEFQSGTWTFRHSTVFQLCDAPVAPLGPWTVTAGSGQEIPNGYNCFAGGFQTWLYNGTNWQLDTSPGTRRPSVRAGHCMAFDSHRGVIVLFGGVNTQTNTYFDDTWEYNGQWGQANPATDPTARADAAMCYDSVRRRIILTAGAGPGGFTRETWEFDGDNWVQRGGVQPPALSDPLFAFDERRNCAVLQGGHSSNGGYYFGTWEYRNGAWTAGVTVPQGLGSDGGMAYDPEERAVMLLDPDFFGQPAMYYYGCADPEFYLQPDNQFLCAGDLLYLSCGARGIGNFSFQWRRNSTNIPGANSSIFFRQNAVPGDTGVYTCVVTSPYGPSAVSDPAIVIVDSGLPTIGAHPAGRIVCEGANVTFSVQASNLWTYQWRRGGVNIPGATSSSYTIQGVTGDDAAIYSCVVGNYCGSVTSNGAPLIVNEEPNVLLLGTSSITIDAGQSATLSMTVIGTQPFTRQWFRNGDPVADGSGGASPGGGTVSGANANSLSITGAQPSDSGVYQLRATNICGEDYGTPITLTVNAGCIADFNHSGGTPDDADIGAFFAAWSAGHPSADVNGSGSTPDDADIAYFFQRWNAGC